MSCTKCRLSQTCKSVKIEARGSDHPRVLFVGQAPGQQEDERNKVFVGPAGRLLLQAIQEYALKPARLTNLVKCFPPGDRNPRADEIKKCQPYLMKEIKDLKPEYIVALGNYALRALTGKTGVKIYSGRVVGQIDSSKVFALYHPSFILRVEETMPKFEMHLRELKRLLQGKNEDKIKVRIVGAREARELIESVIHHENEFVTFDYETTGIHKTSGAEIRCVGFHVSGQNIVVPANSSDFKAFMRWFLKNPVRKCAHNSIFERRWSMEEFGVAPKNLDIDTMLMHYLIDENARHELESLASQFLQVRSWDINALMVENKWTWATIPFEKLAYYNGLDVYYTHQLADKFLVEVEEVDRAYYGTLLPLSRLCARLESRGLKLDEAHAKKVLKLYTERCDLLKKKMTRILKLENNFNPNSGAQVRKIASGVLKIETGEKTEGGQMSVKAEALEPFKDNHPFVEFYLEWKEKKTLCNNYLAKFPRFMDKNGLIHAGFNPGFIVTGRVAVSNPPVQNVPQDPLVRGMFVSRFTSGQILSTDYDQLEMRLVASEANEKNLLQVFEKGGDPHDTTAELMFGKNFTKEERAIAKNINFGTVYGIQAYSLSKKFNVPKDTAYRWLERFERAYPGIYKWMREQHAFVRNKGYLRSRFSRMRRFPEAVGADDYTLARILRQAGNFPIQSQGADINNIAACLVDQNLRRGKYRSLLVNIVHDSIIIDVYPGEEKPVMELTKRVMEEEMKAHTPWLRVNLQVSQELSKRWGGLNQ